MRKLNKVVISISVDGVEDSIPLEAVMTNREFSSIKNKVIAHMEKCNDLRAAEADQLREKLAELEG